MLNGERALLLGFKEQAQDHFASTDVMTVLVKLRVLANLLHERANALLSRKRNAHQRQHVSCKNPRRGFLPARDDFKKNLAQEQAIPVCEGEIAFLLTPPNGLFYPADSRADISV